MSCITADELPPEIWSKILSYLETQELLEVSLVCRSWRDLIRNDSNIIRHLTMKPYLTTEEMIQFLDAWPSLKILETQLVKGSDISYATSMAMAEKFINSKVERVICRHLDASQSSLRFNRFDIFKKKAVDILDGSCSLELDLESEKIRWMGLQHLLKGIAGECIMLEHLTIDEVNDLTGEFIKNIPAAALPKLKRLTIKNYREFDYSVDDEHRSFSEMLPELKITTLCLSLLMHGGPNECLCQQAQNNNLLRMLGPKCPQLYKLMVNVNLAKTSKSFMGKLSWHLMELLYFLTVQFPKVTQFEMTVFRQTEESFEDPEEPYRIVEYNELFVKEVFDYACIHVPEILREISTFKMTFIARNEGVKDLGFRLVKYPMRQPQIEVSKRYYA